jgi:hypothetical protein
MTTVMGESNISPLSVSAIRKKALLPKTFVKIKTKKQEGWRFVVQIT